MKLRNKKTGEIRNAVDIDMYTDSVYLKVSDGEFDNETIEYHSLAELNAEWEDYEEPNSGIEGIRLNDMISGRHIVEIDFTKVEEAERTVKKLKAWKRLKDKKFMFYEWYKPDGCEPFIVIETNIDLDDVDNMGLQKDLDLLFGGEE